jgi:hypothetical protein
MNLDLLHANIVIAAPQQKREYEAIYAGFPKRARLATHDGIEMSPTGDRSNIYFWQWNLDPAARSSLPLTVSTLLRG